MNTRAEVHAFQRVTVRKRTHLDFAKLRWSSECSEPRVRKRGSFDDLKRAFLKIYLVEMGAICKCAFFYALHSARNGDLLNSATVKALITNNFQVVVQQHVFKRIT